MYMYVEFVYIHIYIGRTDISICLSYQSYKRQGLEFLVTSNIIDCDLQERVRFGVNIDLTTYKNGKRETHNPSGRAYPAIVWDHYQVRACICLSYLPTLLLVVCTYSLSYWLFMSTQYLIADLYLLTLLLVIYAYSLSYWLFIPMHYLIGCLYLHTLLLVVYTYALSYWLFMSRHPPIGCLYLHTLLLVIYVWKPSYWLFIPTHSLIGYLSGNPLIGC